MGTATLSDGQLLSYGFMLPEIDPELAAAQRKANAINAQNAYLALIRLVRHSDVITRRGHSWLIKHIGKGRKIPWWVMPNRVRSFWEVARFYEVSTPENVLLALQRGDITVGRLRDFMYGAGLQTPVISRIERVIEQFTGKPVSTATDDLVDFVAELRDGQRPSWAANTAALELLIQSTEPASARP